MFLCIFIIYLYTYTRFCIIINHQKSWDVYLLFVFLFYDVELKVDSIGQLVWGLASDMAGRGGFACTPETNVAPENGGFPIGIPVSRGLFSGATVGGKNYSNPYIP